MIFVVSLLIYILIVAIILYKISANKLLNPNTWILIIYSFLLTVHFTFDVKYNAGNKYAVLPYFLISIFSVICGTNCGRMSRINTIFKYITSFNIKKMAFLSTAASIILIIDILRNNSIVELGTRIDDFKISIIGTIASAIAGLGLIPWLALLYRYLICKGKLPYYSFLSLFAFVSYDIVTGGRQTLFASIIATFVMISWCLKKRKEHRISYRLKIPKSVYIAVLIFISYFLIVSAVRTSLSEEDTRVRYLEYVYSAKLGQETREFISDLGPLSDIVTEFGFYYSQELNRLDIMLDYYEPQVYFIPFEMSYITRRFPAIREIGDKQWAAQEKVFSKVDFFAHSWSTFLGNYYSNYGFLGAIIACFITGLIMGRFQKDFILKKLWA